MSLSFESVASLGAASALAVVAGGWPWRAPHLVGSGARWPRALAAGALALHLGLAVASLCGWRWSRALIVAAAALAWLLWGAVARFEIPRAAPAERAAARLDSGVGVALALLLIVFATAPELAAADFFYHWGFKAQRFALDAGVDPTVAAAASAWRTHPAYPTLVPELLALPASLAGRADPFAGVGLSAVALAAGVAAALRALGDRPRLERALLGVALAGAVGAFFVAGRLAGAADPFLALAAGLGAAALAGGDGAGARAETALAAMFAVAVKLEGALIAGALLAGAWTLARGDLNFGWRRRWRAIAPALLGTLAVALPWWAFVASHGLGERELSLSAGAALALVPARLPAIAAGAVAALSSPGWWAAPSALALLPLLFFFRSSRRARVLAGATLALFAAYLGIYLVSPHEPAFYIASSLPRLLLPLVLLAFVSLAVAASDRLAAVDAADGTDRLAAVDENARLPAIESPSRLAGASTSARIRAS